MFLGEVQLAACTSAPKQPTPVHIDNRPACPLTLCVLPSRDLLLTNDDWRMAVDELEDELLACAVQVKICMELQKQKSLQSRTALEASAGLVYWKRR